MLRTRGPLVQDNWDLWINVSVFAYNTRVSSSTGVFPTPSVEKRTMYQWTGEMLKERQHAYKSMRDVQVGRVWRNTQMYKLLTQNIPVRCLLWYFDPRIIPGTSHKLRLYWGGPYRVSRLIDPAFAEIKPVYYPREEKLVSLDVLKLYLGKDMIG